jgi:hypothetical protein
MSPKGAAAALRQPLGLVTHHSKVLYEEGHGLLDITRKRRVRGATATFYRLKPWGTRTNLNAEGQTQAEVAQLLHLEFLIEAIASSSGRGTARVMHQVATLGKEETGVTREAGLSAALETLESAEGSSTGAKRGGGDGQLYVCGVSVIPLTRWRR